MKTMEFLDENIKQYTFLNNLELLVNKNKIMFSNVDEYIIRKTQQFEQEYFYADLTSSPLGSIYIEDEEIRKTLDSGSAWMK